MRALIFSVLALAAAAIGPLVADTVVLASSVPTPPTVEVARDAFLQRLGQTSVERIGEFVAFGAEYYGGETPFGIRRERRPESTGNDLFTAGILKVNMFEKTNGQAAQFRGGWYCQMWYQAELGTLRDFKFEFGSGGTTARAGTYPFEGRLVFMLTENGWILVEP